MLSKAQFHKAFQHFPYFKVRNLAPMKPSHPFRRHALSEICGVDLKQPRQPLPSAVLYNLLQASFTQNRETKNQGVWVFSGDTQENDKAAT